MAVYTEHRLGEGTLEMVWAEVDTRLLEETGINMDIGELRHGVGEHVRNVC